MKEARLVNAVERVGLAVALAILVGGAFFTLPLLTDSSSTSRVAARTTDIVLGAAPAALVDEREDSDAGNGFMDLYGNEVTDAIATYTFDQAGSLYELHSPQTELPRLGIPKS
jgi:hypothetical protein